MRRVEPQGAAQRRQPHAGRGGGAHAASAGARLDRHRPPLRSGARALLHLVELPLTGLDEERPGPPTRPYVGIARACRAPERTHGPGALQGMGAAIRSRPADLRDRGLSEAPSQVRQAIAALRAGRPVRIEGAGGITVLAVETATPDTL